MSRRHRRDDHGFSFNALILSLGMVGIGGTTLLGVFKDMGMFDIDRFLEHVHSTAAQKEQSQKDVKASLDTKDRK